MLATSRSREGYDLRSRAPALTRLLCYTSTERHSVVEPQSPAKTLRVRSLAKQGTANRFVTRPGFSIITSTFSYTQTSTSSGRNSTTSYTGLGLGLGLGIGIGIGLGLGFEFGNDN